MSIRNFKFIVLFVLVIVSTSAQAFPLPITSGASHDLNKIVPSEAIDGVDFTSIVALSNCSGSLVRFTTSLATDQAMILTNGHCLGGSGFLKPGEVRADVPVSRSFVLLSPDGQDRLGTLTANRVLYATMTGSDITLYRLNETFGAIEKKFGTVALTFSPQHPVAGRKIVIASGYWKTLYSCTIDKFIYELREDAWTFKDSIRYSQPGCETIHGTSGSPIIDAETHEIVGINNTGNDDGEKCTMNNPCEVDSDGNITVNHKASYGQQTYWFYSCLTANNTLDLAKPGCELAH